MSRLYDPNILLLNIRLFIISCIVGDLREKKKNDLSHPSLIDRKTSYKGISLRTDILRDVLNISFSRSLITRDRPFIGTIFPPRTSEVTDHHNKTSQMTLDNSVERRFGSFPPFFHSDVLIGLNKQYLDGVGNTRIIYNS